jgi:hypothetical protein
LTSPALTRATLVLAGYVVAAEVQYRDGARLDNRLLIEQTVCGSEVIAEHPVRSTVAHNCSPVAVWVASVWC